MGFRIRPATTLLVLLTIVLGLQIVAIISVPVTKSIALCTYEGYKFGVFGLCNGDECSAISIGYTSSELSDSISNFSLPSKARKSVSKLLVVHVVSAGFSLIMFLNSIVLHWSGPSKSLRFLLFNLLLSIPTFLLSLLSFLVDILLFVPHLDWGGWVVLAATVLISVCSILLCIMRRTASSRHGHIKNYGKSNVTDSSEYQMAPLSYGYGTVDGGSFVKPLESQDNDEADDTFDGVGYQSRYTDISQIPQTTRYDHVRDGSVVSSSHNGYLSRSSPYTDNNTPAIVEIPLLDQREQTETIHDQQEQRFKDKENDFQGTIDFPQPPQDILAELRPTYRPQDLPYINPEPLHQSEYNQYYEPTSPLTTSEDFINASKEPVSTPYPTTDPTPEFRTNSTILEPQTNTAPYPTTDPVPAPEIMQLDTLPLSPSSPTDDEQSLLSQSQPGLPGKLLGPRPYRGSTTSLQDFALEESKLNDEESDNGRDFPVLSKGEVTVVRKPTYRTQIENSLNALQPEENILEGDEDKSNEKMEELEYDGDSFDSVKRRSQGARIGRNIGALDKDDFESSILTDYNQLPHDYEDSNDNTSDFTQGQIVPPSQTHIASSSQYQGENDITSEYSARIPSISSSAYPPSQIHVVPPTDVSNSSIQESNFNKEYRNQPIITPEDRYFESQNPGPSQFIMAPSSQASHLVAKQTQRLVPEIPSYHNPQTHQTTTEDLQALTEYKTDNLQLPSPEDLRSTPPPSFAGQSFTSSHYTSVSQRGINPEYMKLHPEEFGLMRMQEDQVKYDQRQKERAKANQTQLSTQAKASVPSQELRPQGNMGRYDVNKTGLMVPPKLNQQQMMSLNNDVIESNPDFNVVGRGKKRNGKK